MMLREGSQLAKTLLLQSLLDTHQNKPMRVNMEEPVELENWKKSMKSKDSQTRSLGSGKNRLKSSEHYWTITKMSYHYMSGNVGMAYSPFINEDILDCYFDYEKSCVAEILVVKNINDKNHCQSEVKLGLVLEEKMIAPSIPKSDNRVEFGLGFSVESLRKNLMVVWELRKPSWCPSPNADLILQATQDVQWKLKANCNHLQLDDNSL